MENDLKKSSNKRKQYLVAAHWVHCFVGSKESTTRWAYEIGVGVVAGQVLNAGRWQDMHHSELKDVQESIDQNDIVETYASEYSSEIVLTGELPFWGEQHDERVPVDVALLLMSKGDRVHTFTIMICRHGCDIDRNELEERIAQAGGAVLSDKCGLGHDLMIREDGRELFIACEEGSVEAFRKARAEGVPWSVDDGRPREEQTSKEYQAAYDVHTAAIRRFTAVRDAYRARKVGDSEYLAARREMAEADVVYDAAFLKEGSARPEG
jgi:hypothetical protein